MNVRLCSGDLADLYYRFVPRDKNCVPMHGRFILRENAAQETKKAKANGAAKLFIGLSKLKARSWSTMASMQHIHLSVEKDYPRVDTSFDFF